MRCRYCTGFTWMDSMTFFILFSFCFSRFKCGYYLEVGNKRAPVTVASYKRGIGVSL